MSSNHSVNQSNDVPPPASQRPEPIKTHGTQPVNLYKPTEDGYRYLYNRFNDMPSHSSSISSYKPSPTKRRAVHHPDKMTSSYANMIGKEYLVFDNLQHAVSTGLPRNVSKHDQSKIRNMALDKEIDYKGASEFARLHWRKSYFLLFIHLFLFIYLYLVLIAPISSF